MAVSQFMLSSYTVYDGILVYNIRRWMMIGSYHNLISAEAILEVLLQRNSNVICLVLLMSPAYYHMPLKNVL